MRASELSDSVAWHAPIPEEHNELASAKSPSL